MLNARQAAYVNNYLLCFNRTQAAEGLFPPTLSRDQLTIRASQLFYEPEVQKAIKLRLEEQAVTIEELLSRWAEQVRSDYSPYINANGTVDIARMVADKKTHLIRRIRANRYGLDIEFYDAQKAQEMLAKYYGMLTNDDGDSKRPVVVTIQNNQIIHQDEPATKKSLSDDIQPDFYLLDGSVIVEQPEEDVMVEDSPNGTTPS